MTIYKIIENNYAKLSKSEKLVADKILSDEINVIQHSITQAAQIAGVSVSLINKFCIKCGFSGWKTLQGLFYNSLHEPIKNVAGMFEEDFVALQNIFNLKKNYINAQINKLNNDIQKSKKIVFFANSNTHKLVEVIAFKLNKLGINTTIYSLVESPSIIFSNDDCIIFVSMSGWNSNQKIRQYSEQFKKCKKQYIITFGSAINIKGVNVIALDAYNRFPKQEKSFPIITDVFMLYLLNKLVYYRLNNTEGIIEEIDKIKMSQL